MEAILFDWDGTLVDSLGAFHRANAIVSSGVRPQFGATITRSMPGTSFAAAVTAFA